MSTKVKRILDSIESLSEIEKQELVSEIIRRTAYLDLPLLTDDELVFNAEALFLELDQREIENE